MHHGIMHACGRRVSPWEVAFGEDQPGVRSRGQGRGFVANSDYVCKRRHHPALRLFAIFARSTATERKEGRKKETQSISRGYSLLVVRAPTQERRLCATRKSVDPFCPKRPRPVFRLTVHSNGSMPELLVFSKGVRKRWPFFYRAEISLLLLFLLLPKPYDPNLGHNDAATESRLSERRGRIAPMIRAKGSLPNDGPARKVPAMANCLWVKVV